MKVFDLDDCGRELHLTRQTEFGQPYDVDVIMVIKTPTGTMVLFDDKPSYHNETNKLLAIKTFMEEHSGVR